MMTSYVKINKNYRLSQNSSLHEKTLSHIFCLFLFKIFSFYRVMNYILS